MSQAWECLPGPALPPPLDRTRHRDKSQADMSCDMALQRRQGDGLTPKQRATTGITLKGILQASSQMNQLHVVYFKK